MKIYAISSIVLLVLLASAYLPSSQANKLIFDQGYMLAEGPREFHVGINYTGPTIAFSFGNPIYHIHGMVWMGFWKPVDVMEMSFVLELVRHAKRQWSPRKEDLLYYQESSPDLMEKVDLIIGQVVIRDLRPDEKMQMDKFKQSHDGSHKFKVVCKDITTLVKSNVKATPFLDVENSSHVCLLTAKHGPANETSEKYIHLIDTEGKSFIIEDAAKGNCENFSLGPSFYCSSKGEFWIEEL